MRGKPLIQYHIERLAHVGIVEIVINLAWLGAMIRDYLGDGSRFSVRIEYSEETPRALEAAGGIFRALPRLGPAAFLVLNGDVFTDYPLAHAALAPSREAHLVLVPNPRLSTRWEISGSSTDLQCRARLCNTPSPASPSIGRSSSPTVSTGRFP